uniref:Dynactin subunit 6 n=1 Tax=Globisporangium ultimum (strain ATCC 200006 / CBS 805.95 / DAOM BR144) TaxID=431595 RepID=K3WQ12_GLOUD
MAAVQSVNVAATSAVCEEAELHGTISIGRQCVVHPKCQIRASAVAPIVIGDRNILEDRVVVESQANADVDGADRTAKASMMAIGTDNLFESGCCVRSSRVGNGNWFEPKAQTLEGSVIGNNCLIGSGVVIDKGEHVPDNTVIVCVQDEQGRMKRIVRQQKDYLLKARETLVQKYIETFLDTKSIFALEKNHRLVPVLPMDL